jgi:tetratricopeptide (TPR) repeat protein
MTGTWVKGWVGTTGADSSMAHWKAQTLSGNRHFDAGEYARALDCYQQALWLARQQFADWHDANEAVAALVVAHHNLADLLVAMTLPDRDANPVQVPIHTPSCYLHSSILYYSSSDNQWQKYSAFHKAYLLTSSGNIQK